MRQGLVWAVLVFTFLLRPSPAEAARGGPDAGGWMWADSREPGVDTTTLAPSSWVVVTSPWGDEQVVAVDLSFAFTLYGVTSNRIWVSSNGWLTLVDPGTFAIPVAPAVPDPAAPNATLAFYWDDLPGGTGTFLQHGSTADGDVLIIRYFDRAAALVQLRIQLERSGLAKVVYQAIGDTTTVTAGIEDQLGTTGTQIAHDGAAAPGVLLERDYAIVYYPINAPNCTTPTPISCGATRTGNTAGGNPDVATYGCAAGSYDGREAVFALDVPQVRDVSVTLSNTGGRSLDAFLLRPSCDGRLGCVTGGAVALNEPLLGAGIWYLVVDGRTPGDDGSFDITVTCNPIAASNLSCGQTAVPAVPGGGLMSSYSCYGGAYPQGEAFYRHQATQRFVARATLTDPTAWDLFLFREADIPGTCLAGGDGAIALANLPPDDYMFTTDAATPTPAPGLSLTCAPMPTTPIGCEQTLAGVTGGASDLDGWPCLGGAHDGGEAYFVIDNPTTQTIAAGVTADLAGTELDVAIVAGPFDPDAAPCDAAGDHIATWTDAPPGEYLIVVDGAAATSGAGLQVTTTCGSSALGCGAAIDLECDRVTAGDTTAAANSAAIYGGAEELYTGPEILYRFNNPVAQTVSLLLASAADPDIDLMLMSACDPSTVVERGDDTIIAVGLPPGDYFVAVDGRAGAAGAFELVRFCGQPALDPPVLSTSLDPGECYTETKRVYFPTTVPEADVMISFDLTGSMGDELNRVKNNARDIYTELSTVIPSLRLGLASLVEYNVPYTDTVCGIEHSGSGWPFRVEQTLTPDINQLDAVLQTIRLQGGGGWFGGGETYVRSFYEAYTNLDIGWRECSRRLWLSFGDEPAMDCNWLSCIGLDQNTGRDPGPDMLTGTPDDLELIPTVDNMWSVGGISLIAAHSSGDPTWNAAWECLSRRTGGRAFLMDPLGNLPGGEDVTRALVRTILETVRPCPTLALNPTGPDASWVTISPSSYDDIVTPFFGEFTIEFCVPPDAPAGNHAISIEASCGGAGACFTELLGTQEVAIEVCPDGPEAFADAPDAVCAGTGLLLDGGRSSSCAGESLEYRWLDGGAEICPWSSNPSCRVTPAATTDYTLEVRCPIRSCIATTSVTVEVADPVAVASDATGCLAEPTTLDASGSRGCPGGTLYEWRLGATVVRPASPDPTYTTGNPMLGPNTYTVVVSCVGLPGCEARRDVLVEVEDCSFAVDFDHFAAIAEGRGRDRRARITWRTASELGTLIFHVERARSADGPWQVVGDTVTAIGAGASYAAIDAEPGAAPWYRIVEYTVAGRGDVTPPFALREPTTSGGRGRGSTRD